MILQRGRERRAKRGFDRGKTDGNIETSSSSSSLRNSSSRSVKPAYLQIQVFRKIFRFKKSFWLDKRGLTVDERMPREFCENSHLGVPASPIFEQRASSVRDPSRSLPKLRKLLRRNHRVFPPDSRSFFQRRVLRREARSRGNSARARVGKQINQRLPGASSLADLAVSLAPAVKPARKRWKT